MKRSASGTAEHTAMARTSRPGCTFAAIPPLFVAEAATVNEEWRKMPVTGGEPGCHMPAGDPLAEGSSSPSLGEPVVAPLARLLSVAGLAFAA